MTNLGIATFHLGDDDGFRRLFSRMLTQARNDGAIGLVLFALPRLALADLSGGNWTGAWPMPPKRWNWPAAPGNSAWPRCRWRNLRWWPRCAATRAMTVCWPNWIGPPPDSLLASSVC